MKIIYNHSMYKKGLMIFCALVIMTLFAFGDVGNFNSYSGGGGGGGYSSGGYSSGGYSGSRGSSGYSSGGNPLVSIILFGVFFFVIIVALALQKAEDVVFGHNTSRPIGRPMNLSDNTQEIARAIWQIDPEFSVDKFLAFTKEVFITLQNAWTARDWERVRTFEKEELYKQHEMQLKEYIERGTINVMERININNAHLFTYERDAQHEYLGVFLNVRMVDYIMEERSGRVLKGSKDTDCFMSYIYTFMRKKGVLTKIAGGQSSIVACPKCGAPTKITSSGRCEYCSFIVTTGEYGWVLSDIKGVNPSVEYGRGGVIIDGKREV